MLPKLYYYDLETFLHCFLFTGKFADDPTLHVFEISRRLNQRDRLLSWLSYLQNAGVTMIGFNTLGFDYPVIHHLMNEPYTFDAQKAYLFAQQIFASQTSERNLHQIRLGDRIIPQIDLFKLNHFDNRAKTTSLKALQFAMRSQSVEDLPFPPDAELTDEMIEQLRAYNAHDVLETEIFGKKCYHLIEMRQELLDTGVLSGDVLNFSDVKIGEEYLIKKIGRTKCYNGKNPKQTFRHEIHFKNIILPKISYRTEEFQAVHDWFRKQVVYVESETRPKLEAHLAGLQFHFGVGGVHASVENRRYHSTATHVIRDIDVSGMYVAVAIANGFAPEHLGQDFVVAYRQLQKDRAQYKKGTTMNAVLKLAGNGVYGKSNSHYSCFYDPQYTFSVTVNGQLELLQLAEALSLIPGLELIQANTDGITAYMPRELSHFFDLWKTDWEEQTGLKLEQVEYDAMYIRDVNNYIAVLKGGQVKRKGAYWYPETEKDYEGWWNKDFSNMAAIKAAEQVMIRGWDPELVVRCITNPFDFMLRYKTPAGAKVFIGDREMNKTVRYYVSTAGEPMKKISKPKGEIGSWKRKNAITDDFYEKVLAEIPKGQWDERIHTKNKSKVTETVTSIESGWRVKECNHVGNFNWSDVDFAYYVAETKKLLIGDKP